MYAKPSRQIEYKQTGRNPEDRKQESRNAGTQELKNAGSREEPEERQRDRILSWLTEKFRQ